MAFPVAAILASAGIGAAASLFGASKQASAAGRAARTVAGATAVAREDLRPFTEAGVGSLNELQILLGLKPGDPSAALRETPGFRFQVEEGVKALDKSAAARGNLISGNQLKAVTEFGQGVAEQTFSNRANQLFGLAGLGQASAAGSANVSQTGAQGVGNALIAGGQARAGGAAGVANAANAGISNLIFSNFLTEQAKAA